MATALTDGSSLRKPLRVWPGVVLVVLQGLVRFVLPSVVPGALGFAMMGGVFGGGLAIVVWWVFFSRAPWTERLGAVAVMVIGALAARPLLDVSIATGAMGMLFPIYVIPTVCLALVVAAVASRRWSDGPRRLTIAAGLLLACGGWTLVRTDGVSGSFDWEFAWRWSETAEERLLAEAGADSVAAADPIPVDGAADWPGFRGPERNGTVRGVRIATDWSTSPPAELWRRPIGPGWSSFAVRGDRLYTQEQRGEDEVVACYDATSGEPVWRHRDAARFWEAMAGAGPRGTPTLSDGRVYTLGATGIVNALDADDGGVVWSRNAASDAEVKLPGWGFASSPLVVGDIVIVAVAGRLAAYDLDNGDLRWVGQIGDESYSSPHLLTIGGVPQVLLMNGDAAISVSPADGTLLWEHAWPGFHSLQPALTADGDLLITVSGSAAGLGIRRLAVAQGTAGWTAEERWTSVGLKPYFNDFVVHGGHAFGFDGRILSCIDLEDGQRRWKGGRYGHGQLVLLADQDLLLVLSEEGELALVGATPDRFTELARLPAIEGKTWNHPVVVEDLLFARNGQEMVAFRLPPLGA